MNRISRHIIPFWIFFSIFNLLIAQDNRWIGLYSYLKVLNTQAVDDKIFAQSENALFIYDTTSGEIEKISSINGLSGDRISNFYYHPDLHKLFVFHEGGFIEIIDEQKKLTKIPDLSYNSFIPNDRKLLNDFFVQGNQIYMATGYGISVFDLENNEFGDTYYTGTNAGFEKVNDIEILDNKIYAATVNGLKTALVDDNLIDYNVWQIIDNKNFSEIEKIDNQLLCVYYNQIYKLSDDQLTEIISTDTNITNLKINDYINIIMPQQVMVYNHSYIQEQIYTSDIFEDEKFYTAIDFGNNIYIGTKKHGLLKTGIAQQNFEEIHPDSPLSNHVFAVDALDNHCWIVYGDHKQFNPYPLYREGVSSYQDGKWINIPYKEFNVSDFSFVKINPTNRNEVYIASPKNGLFRLKNNQIDAYFNEFNSPLQNYADNGVRVFAMNFDSQNNLWVTQRSRPALLKLKPDDTWESISLYSILRDISDYHGFDELSIDKDDNVWLGTEYFGVIGYNPQTRQIIANKNGIEPASYTYITGMDIDKDNTMWVGNQYGLRIMPDPQKMFDNPSATFQPIKINYENEVQLLMEGQNIVSINVDGSNNKWIATLGSGVYYVSEDGDETIYHFTKENSPLPSNDIYDIAIDGTTGIVYFASLSGLTAFKASATEAGENMNDVYAFPNPVHLNMHTNVTIRGLVENVSVKIVDVEGNLVFETISKGGSVNWDLTAFGKYQVASGVYVALISNKDGSQTQTTKILVIK